MAYEPEGARALLRRFWRDNSGATAIEYAMIGSFLSIMIYTAAKVIGTKLVGDYFAPVSANLT